MYEFSTGYHLYVLSLARVLGLHLVFLDYFLPAILEQSSKMKWSTSSWFSVLWLPNGLRGLYLVWNLSFWRGVFHLWFSHGGRGGAVQTTWQPCQTLPECPSVISGDVPLNTLAGQWVCGYCLRLMPFSDPSLSWQHVMLLLFISRVCIVPQLCIQNCDFILEKQGEFSNVFALSFTLYFLILTWG